MRILYFIQFDYVKNIILFSLAPGGPSYSEYLHCIINRSACIITTLGIIEMWSSCVWPQANSQLYLSPHLGHKKGIYIQKIMFAVGIMKSCPKQGF